MRGNAVRRIILVLVAAIVVLACGVLIAGAAAAPKPREMKFACAKSSTGALRYVGRASLCKRSEKTITISDAAPVDVCVLQRRTRRLPAGWTRLVDAMTACSTAPRSKEAAIKLPGPKKQWFCALKKTGSLRSVARASKCSRKSELAVFVNKAKPAPNPQPEPTPNTPQAVNVAPTARDDDAATDEHTVKSISPLGNDSDPEGSALGVATVDATGAAGTATITPGGTVSYDPNGAFEDLAAGDTATDSFTYRASDHGLPAARSLILRR